jgi:endonuclease/exonuclease/phosphatase family metal-dependent hydrolase
MQLVTWNIQWCRGADGRVDPARIVADARAFADFDVLCLQEVAGNFPALAGSRGEDQFALLAEQLPGYTAVPGIAVDVPAPDGTRRRFGNLILSRLPVLQVLRHQLPWPADPGVKSMPRMLLEATIAAPFGPLRVMTTHLEYYSEPQRAAQVEAIRRRHAEACAHALGAARRGNGEDPFASQPQTVSAILTGDFNFRPSDPLHARMTAGFDDVRVPPLEDAWQRVHGTLERPPTLGVYDHEQWPEAFACDFIWTSRDLGARLRAVEIDAGTAASDHQPVRVELAP